MEFNFVDYREDIFEKSITDNPAAVYVFNNYENLQTGYKYYEKPFLEENSIFITLSDFKEKLFPVDKIILKEEKLSVIFYELLTENEKKQLQINNYFDAIEVANQFFNFYSELQEYKIKEITNLEEWQQYKYEFFQQLRDRYIRHMQKLGYTDHTLMYNWDNFSLQFLQDYDNIGFVNIINFTPRETELLSRLERHEKNITINLQLDIDDYNRENLTITSVNFPENNDTEIHLLQLEEDLLQLVNLINLVEGNKEFINDINDEITIIDANYNNSNYQQLLSANRITINKEVSFKQTKIYRFLNTLYNMLKHADFTHDSLLLQLEDVLDACYLEEFCQYYQLSSETQAGLINLAAEDYVYLSQELLENKNLTELLAVWEDILQIRRCNNLLDFCEFLEVINLEILNDKNYGKNLDRYFDALLELKSLAEMNIVSDWDSYFDNKNLNLFYLILRYLQFKKVTPISDADKKSFTVEPLVEGNYRQHEHLFMLNVSVGMIPSADSSSFLLTEKQREKHGLPSAGDKRLLQKYYFFRHVFSSNCAYIFSINNVENNITASPFVEELRLKYDLPYNEPDIRTQHYPEIITNIFYKNDYLFDKAPALALTEEDKLKISKDDFPDKGFPLTYYKYNTLKKCYYNFYLEHIAGLKTGQLDFSKEMDLKVLGILVHEIIEKIIVRIKTNNFNIDKKIIEQISEQIFADYYLKYNHYYQKYYHNILLDVICRSIIKFFDKIKKRIEEIDNIVTEWKPVHKSEQVFMAEKITDIYLSGRMDLLINTPEKTHIIDFKTGGGDLEQLDFYALILSPHIISKLEKSIYYIFKESLITARDGSEEKFASKLCSELKQFLGSEDYKKVFKSYCQWCDYFDICRVVVS